MTIKIGTFLVENGTNDTDYNLSVKSGEAYFGRGNDDILWSTANAVLPDKNGNYYYVPSILIGGAGSDGYRLDVNSHTIIFDSDRGSSSDELTIFYSVNTISNFITIDNRHLFITLNGGDLSTLVVDGMNHNGAIESIKFRDISFNGSPESINTLVNTYSQGNYSIEEAISSGVFNPKLMGVDNASEVKTTIKEIYTEASRWGAAGLYKSYSGNSYDYIIKENSQDNYSLINEGIPDPITGYTFLRFADKDLFIIDDIKETFDQVTGLNTDSGKMFRLYNAAFKRLPDADGLKYWIDKYSSGENDERAVASSFLISDEFALRYGTDITDTTYVNTLYKNVLGRDADTSGLNYWLGQLNSGSETRYEVLLGFSESAENKALFTDMTGFG